jgi:hypothetical protein
MGFWKFVLGFRFLISDTHPSFGFLIDSPSKIQSPISALLSWWIPLFSSFHFSKLHVPFYINLRDLERVMILVSLSTYLPLRSLCKVWCFLNLHIVWSVACHSALASYELSYFIWYGSICLLKCEIGFLPSTLGYVDFWKEKTFIVRGFLFVNTNRDGAFCK